MATIHLGGHPSQGHTHGVRHVWGDASGIHTTTFWYSSEQEARDAFPSVSADCREAPLHHHMELVVDGVGVPREVTE